MLRHYLLHKAHTLQAQFARQIVALAAIFEFRIWSADVKPVYLQSIVPLKRCTFIGCPAPKSELEPEECVELLNPVYVLADAVSLCTHK